MHLPPQEFRNYLSSHNVEMTETISIFNFILFFNPSIFMAVKQFVAVSSTV